jgi:hypothetical protein
MFVKTMGNACHIAQYENPGNHIMKFNIMKMPTFMREVIAFGVLNFNIILVVAEECRPDIFFTSYNRTLSFKTFHIQLILLFSVFTAFFWVVLYSYYRQMEEEKNPNCGNVNCTYQIPNEQVQMLGVDGKPPSYSPNKLAPDMA